MMIDKKAIENVKKFQESGDTLSVAIKKSAAYFKNSKIVETQLAKYFTRDWSSSFVE